MPKFGHLRTTMRTIRMSRSDVIKEHRRLVKILRHGTQRQRQFEARRQARELKSYKK